jgi:hypothetical protein
MTLSTEESEVFLQCDVSIIFESAGLESVDDIQYRQDDGVSYI